MISVRTCKSVVIGLGLLMRGVVPAFGSLSASATISSVPDGGNFDYTIKVTDTGTSNIGTFWFAWTPPGDPVEYDFLPTPPTTAGQPAGWIGSISPGFPATSIEYYNVSGSPISTGQTDTFTFTSADSPTVLQGTQFGIFPITESFIYAGAPEVGSFAQVNPTFIVPEPASLTLVALGCGVCTLRRRRASR
jgi:hypothetical protein